MIIKHCQRDREREWESVGWLALGKNVNKNINEIKQKHKQIYRLCSNIWIWITTTQRVQNTQMKPGTWDTWTHAYRHNNWEATANISFDLIVILTLTSHESHERFNVTCKLKQPRASKNYRQHDWPFQTIIIDKQRQRTQLTHTHITKWWWTFAWILIKPRVNTFQRASKSTETAQNPSVIFPLFHWNQLRSPGESLIRTEDEIKKDLSQNQMTSFWCCH